MNVAGDRPPGRPVAAPPDGSGGSRELALALRKQRLMLKSDALRIRLAGEAQVLVPAFVAADRVRDGWRWVKSHPEWVAGAAALLVALRPRKVLRWARRAYGAFRALRSLRRWAEERLATLGT
ncbi:MAG TPA: YqjK family protein [Rhodocyclaceae bacterium]|nr:YqjK family protein [Rhodocyclaceae bacterium]